MHLMSVSLNMYVKQTGLYLKSCAVVGGHGKDKSLFSSTASVWNGLLSNSPSAMILLIKSS